MSSKQESLFSRAVPVFMKSFGRLHPDKFFYVIWREGKGGGMFSNVFHVLAHIAYARDLGLTPVVDMKHFPGLYNEPEKIKGTFNAWEYYFMQPSAQTLDEVYKSRRAVFCHGSGNAAFAAYHDFDKARHTAARQLKPQAYVAAMVEDFNREHFAGQKVLGVHFRGQEMKQAPGHPVPPTEEQMLERVRLLLKKLPIDIIFIVSEDQGHVDLFYEHFGARVRSSPAFRTYGENAYLMRPYPREQHMYRLGLEVLVDALLLARCDYLLAGGYGGLAFGSGVSMAAQIFKDGQYEHLELIYNGIQPGGPGQQGFINFM
ncbi:hypothetical protein LJC15_02645, partial [Desulfovibrio sp. OttesenSCG-928-G11]|nr:hypothetical protein [Desulfovibrio sp. OttesenSCG-928-G11]